MGYGYLREKRRRVRLPLLIITSSLLLLAALVGIGIELIRYNRLAVPTRLTVDGVEISGSEDDVMRRLEQIYEEQPLYLYYSSSAIELHPNRIGFEVDSAAILVEAKSDRGYWAGFWNYLWNRPSDKAKDVRLRSSYDVDQLRDFLVDIAGRYDVEPGQADFSLLTLSIEQGAPGTRLDVDEAARLIDAALHKPDAAQRRVTLPIQEVPPRDGTLPTLSDRIQSLIVAHDFADNPDRLASVYVMDLETGEEVSILGDVPHSAVSTIKIPIMINVFRANDDTPIPDIAYLLTESLLCSNNNASNLLIESTGAYGTDQAMMMDGLNQVSCMSQRLGAEHTFINAPLEVGDPALRYTAPVCLPDSPANTAFDTNPDRNAQTTAQDMGLLLTEIYDCAFQGSGLRAIYPDDFTQTECEQMIEMMSGNRIDRLIELGVPPGTRIAHKNGWWFETSADAGIVFSPGGDYVLALYTWERDTDGNNLPTIASWELIEAISRLVYNATNPDAPLLQPRQPIHPLTAIHCVTVMSPELVDLNDINKNRLDENGNPLPTACYGGQAEYNPATGECMPFDNWGIGQ